MSRPNFEASNRAASRPSLYGINEYIPRCQRILSALPRSHPRRPTWVYNLASVQLQRYGYLIDKRDVDTSILHFTYTILQPLDFPIYGATLRIMAFFSLTRALSLRSLKHREHSDIETSIKYIRYRLDHSLAIVSAERGEITLSLVLILTHQIVCGFANVLANMAEITTLCSELLASDDLKGPQTKAVQSLILALHHTGLKDQPLDRVIVCLRDAYARLPDLHDASIGLAHSLLMRFHEDHTSGDYEEGMAIIDKIIASYSSRRQPDTQIFLALNFSTMLVETRFSYSKNPKYFEEGIFRLRAILSILSPEHEDYLRYNRLCARLEKIRSNEFGVPKSLPDFPNPEVIDNHTFSSLASSLAKSNALKSPVSWAHKRLHRDMLIDMGHLTDMADMKEAIKYCRLLLPSLPSTDDMALHTAISLGELLFRAFKYTNNADHLNESITVLRDALKMPAAQWGHFKIIRLFILCLFARVSLSNDRKDLDEINQLYPIAAADKNATVPDRFKVAFQWVLFSGAYEYPSSMPTAYDSAFSLMQDTLVFAPTLETQHFRLASMRDDHKRLPLDYAACQVQIGQLKQAIETLEGGRGLLWSEMRGLRSSIDRLGLVDMQLADKFAALNRDLEALTTSGPPRVPRGADQVEGGERMGPFGHLVVGQREIVEERDRLILKVRTLPGFDRFLMTPLFDTLRLAAARGPVIIINHSRFRSDILILFHDTPPSLIAMDNDFYHRANGLKDQLLAARKEGLHSKTYDDALKSVLESLYDLVGHPVIQVLRKSNVPEQSRIWWCPTSVFCSLPLHAMGPSPSDGGAKVYFSDLYISSYTPTLSALIESRKPGAQTISRPSLLLVAQPDGSLPGVKGEIRVIQALETQVTSLISRNATVDTVVEGLRNHQLVHFACHGMLEKGKPFDASFKLHRKERLTLLHIIRSRVPAAEVAFLSACHTAELTEESIADEALHLAAAMQYCGFRSVVGTMWAMADMDGRDLAKLFYTNMLSDSESDEGKTTMPLYERSAVSLRDAVQRLRQKSGMTLERWVNFVHYGG
ncbi:CHAT domain-containing protein [Russula dissimulans]|nr:CHAT domain-containing protein [Russula dissimulans]